MDEKKIARAEHKYARIAPRKVEIICNMIRGKNAKLAMALMENTPKAGCELMIKVLKSAMANAENREQLRNGSREALRLPDLRRRRPHPQEGHAQSAGPYVPHQQTHQPHHDRRG